MTLLEKFVFDKLCRHPLPWKARSTCVDSIWVDDANGDCVMALNDDREDELARELIGMAQLVFEQNTHLRFVWGKP